jgi:hypothetical protein
MLPSNVCHDVTRLFQKARRRGIRRATIIQKDDQNIGSSYERAIQIDTKSIDENSSMITVAGGITMAAHWGVGGNLFDDVRMTF